MTYDPKAKRPDTEDREHAAPVDQLLGGAPAEPADPGAATADLPPSTDAAGVTAPSTPAVTPDPVPLPEPVPARRTARTVAAAVVAVVVVLIAWRRRRR